MIRKLKIKFVCVVMAAAALMVGGILGVVVYFTGQSMEMQSLSAMQTIAAAPFQQGVLGKTPENEVRLPFFSVQISSMGELITAGGGYFDLSDREYIQRVVNEALRSADDAGELEEFELRYLKTVTQVGFTIVFSDMSTERATMNSLLQSCLLIFFAAMLVFLGLSILLARWVVKPVAAAWTQQRQFVADASHELKTPLSVIMANAELLQNGEAEAEEKFSRNILTTSYQMRSLIESMLEMARVDNGSAEVRRVPLDLSQLVRDAVLSFQLLYEEKGLRLYSAVEEGILLRGSEQHLYQVLDVLLDNALKYAAQGSTVNVELKRSGKYGLLSVFSAGKPLAQDELRDIFKRFYRADPARESNGSYGLGLSIAESAVRAHKGKIWAQSTANGNVFFVRLPIYKRR